MKKLVKEDLYEFYGPGWTTNTTADYPKKEGSLLTPVPDKEEKFPPFSPEHGRRRVTDFVPAAERNKTKKDKSETKAWKILEFIGSKGEEGVGLTEIQKFIWVNLFGKSEESFWKTEKVHKYGGHGPANFANRKETTARTTRGIYGTNLYGAVYAFSGLLHEYCKKNAKGKWVLDHMPEPGKPIYKENPHRSLSYGSRF